MNAKAQTTGSGPGGDRGGARRAGARATDQRRPLTRREREYLRHREEVMAATEHLLLVKDHREITVQDIAAEAEFSVGYLYKLFTSKDEIFAAIVRLRHRQALEVLRTAVDAPGTASERLHRLIVDLFAWLERNVPYNSLSFRSLQSLVLSDARLQQAVVAGRDEMEAALKVLCSDAIEEGTFAAIEPQLIARTLRALVTGFIKEEILDRDFSSAARPQLEHGQIAGLIERTVRRAFAPEATNEMPR